MGATPSTTAPSTPNRPAGLNRSLLSFIGLFLALVGAYTLLRAVGALATGTSVAFGVPAQDPRSALLPALTAPAWLPWAVIVAAVLVGLLCLRWLLAQTGRRARSQTWRFDSGRGPEGNPRDGYTRMDGSAAAAAFAAEVADYTGVHSARAVLTGDRGHPALHLTVGVADHAHVSEIRGRIDTHALPRLRGALELEELPTEILVRLGATSATTRTR